MFTIYSEICHVIIHKLASWKFFDSNNIRIINFAFQFISPLNMDTELQYLRVREAISFNGLFYK